VRGGWGEVKWGRGGKKKRGRVGGSHARLQSQSDGDCGEGRWRDKAGLKKLVMRRIRVWRKQGAIATRSGWGYRKRSSVPFRLRSSLKIGTL